MRHECRSYWNGICCEHWDNGKEIGNYYSILGLYGGNIGIMEKKMETIIVYWGYIGVILGYWKRKWKLL